MHYGTLQGTLPYTPAALLAFCNTASPLPTSSLSAKCIRVPRRPAPESWPASQLRLNMCVLVGTHLCRAGSLLGLWVHSWCDRTESRLPRHCSAARLSGPRRSLFRSWHASGHASWLAFLSPRDCPESPVLPAGWLGRHHLTPCTFSCPGAVLALKQQEVQG